MPRTHVPATSTHAIRNPGKAVQQPKPRQPCEKEEARLQRRAYEQDIETFNEYRDREIARISKSSFKTTRKKNLRNAIKHDRALKAKASGEQKSLEEYNGDLQNEVDDGAVFDEESLGKVEPRLAGARATNKAAANDARKTSMSIGEQLTNLYERTGVRALAIFSRGNADDDALPQGRDSDNALEFFLQEMGTDQLDVMRKFEHYSCTMDEATRKKNDVKSVRADIVEAPHKRAPNTKVVMATPSTTSIRAGHGVEMAGWPKDVPVERAGAMNAESAAYPPYDPRGGDPLGVDVEGSAGSADQGAGRATCGVGRDVVKRKEGATRGRFGGPR
ncbi:hypothetical protein B0H14DRAFT_2656779, partial [Mycena olivaceomarginata]